MTVKGEDTTWPADNLRGVAARTRRPSWRSGSDGRSGPGLDPWLCRSPRTESHRPRLINPSSLGSSRFGPDRPGSRRISDAPGAGQMARVPQRRSYVEEVARWPATPRRGPPFLIHVPADVVRFETRSLRRMDRPERLGPPDSISGYENK